MTKIDWYEIRVFSLYILSCVLLIIAVAAISSQCQPEAQSYDKRRAIALTWLAEHQDEWRYTMCNTMLKEVKQEPMDSKGDGK